VVLNLTEVTFLDSSGLGVIAQYLQACPSGSFVLRNPQDNVRGAIEAVGIGHLLEG
jgi:anti-anti-sigma factor